MAVRMHVMLRTHLAAEKQRNRHVVNQSHVTIVDQIQKLQWGERKMEIYENLSKSTDQVST